MTIQPIGSPALTSGAAGTSYDAARTNAEERSFQATLDDLQRKASVSGAASAASGQEAQGFVRTMTDADAEAKKLREACEGFEAMFLSMMYKQMRATVPEGGLFGKKSNAMNIFEDMRDTELMNEVSKSGGIGIADMMYKQLAPTALKK
ncbi:rod-binding protein [Selenomonas artemidis]|jgi:peptidoglycan hydrolase flgJ|uniref:Peptidase, M23/M37 family n=1 Tax=Selenomonas artemidis F0399 TaxID=749551 RepID=E7N3L1_9FIRM|nr:rod-binding protein [Selenomonas artemidis]EFW29196.1 peptidase, M23/M37 family [Selenomonas artemidis F0399]